jgi:acetyl esterase/lipase
MLADLLIPRRGYRIHRDLAYGADARQMLDLYIPARLTAPAPVLLYFYGGSWQSGSRAHYRFLGQAFASRGVIVAVADYRLFPPSCFPDFIEDGALALRFIHTNIAGHGGDPARIFLAGHSAGAYIATMLAANATYLNAAKASPEWIAGIIGIAGPYDFLPLRDPKLIEIFHGKNDPNTQPIHFVDRPLPPMLLLHGSKDKTVSPRNATRMATKLRSVNSPVEVIVYPGLGHIAIILALVRGLGWLAPVRDDVIRFIAAH